MGHVTWVTVQVQFILSLSAQICIVSLRNPRSAMDASKLNVLFRLCKPDYKYLIPLSPNFSLNILESASKSVV